MIAKFHLLLTVLLSWLLSANVDSLAGGEIKAAAGRVSQIIAHRGASAERPECTLVAIQRTIEVGATAVEVDVRTSRDGKLFILHDSTLDRTTNGKGPANALTLEELQKLDAGTWFAPKFRGERIPSLAEAAKASRGRIDLLLDLKEQGDDYDRKVVELIKRHGDPKRTIVGVRSVAQAVRFRRLLPTARQLALIPSVESIEDFAKAGVDTIRIWPRWLKDGDGPVKRVRAAGKQLHLNGTLGEIGETRRLLLHGPDSLSSDHPGRLKRTLQLLSGAAGVPQTVEEAWAAFDPQTDPLETEVVREESANGVVTRYVRYVVGTFAGRKTRVAAFYAFPKGARGLPGIVQVHGGGQFARKELVQYYASRGYAAIAVNWGEKVIDRPEDPNTDWAGIPAGFLDPKHHNGVEPGEETIHNEPHPWNSSWLLYSAAARRAITFLEQQPECDGQRIGLQGHSMGGRVTVLTAIDPRIKAASPSVGGSGYLYSDIAGVPGSARRMPTGPDRELYLKTLDCKEYWPEIECPVMFLGATNDFNSPMEFVVRGFQSLPDVRRSRMSFTPHMNHRFTADNVAARIRWFDTHLKNSFVLPKTATAELVLKTDTGVPRFTVRPDLSTPHELDRVSIYYGYDRDPRARFWRSAEVTRDGDVFSADCPVMEPGEPLFVFANVTYRTKKSLAMPRGYRETSLLTVTSECRRALPDQLAEAGVKVVGDRQRLIDDFKHGWRDWSLVGTGHTEHWNYETHKVNDPAFVGPRGALLALDIETTAPGNTLAVVMDVDRWRGYTQRRPRRFTALVKLSDQGHHSLQIPLEQFVTADGDVLENYDFVTSLILTPGQKERPDKVPAVWQGKVPRFGRIRWVGGDFSPRPRPYLRADLSQAEADALLSEPASQTPAR